MSLRPGHTLASQEKKTQNVATKPNWIRVRVAGLGKVLRMAFEEVFVMALDIYQTRQRTYSLLVHIPL